MVTGIMTVILADKQFIEYYSVDATRTGTIAAAPWATTGLAQLFVGGTLANLVGRLWALRISISVMIIGVGKSMPIYSANPSFMNPVPDIWWHNSGTKRAKYIWGSHLRPPLDRPRFRLCLHCNIAICCRMFTSIGRSSPSPLCSVGNRGLECVWQLTILLQLRGSFVGTVTQFGYQLGTFIAFWAG